jgi:hypothetical protein
MIAAAAVIMLAGGCGSAFYVSESDARVLNVTLNTAATFSELIAQLPGPSNGQVPSFEVDFDNSSGSPRISNLDSLRQVIRGLGDLATFEANNRQFDLERFTAQLQDRLNPWIADHLHLITDAAGSDVRITHLDRLTARLAAPLAVTYDASSATIRFQGSAAISIQGGMHVAVLSGPGSWLASAFHENPNGDYGNVVVSLFPLPLVGTIYLMDARFPDASLVRLHLAAPTDGGLGVSVTGINDGNVVSGIQAVFRRQLSAPVDRQYPLAFDDFVISALRLSGSDAALSFEYHPRPAFAAPVGEAVLRTANGGLAHLRQMDGIWRDPQPIALPGPVAGDPALSISGPNAFTVASVSRTGSLYVIDWRSGRFAEAATFQVPNRSRGGPNPKRLPPPVFVSTATPAVFASAPGQTDIVAADSRGTLWHLRRIDGAWQRALVPTGLSGTRPLRDPRMVSLGRWLALAYVDADAQVWLQTFDYQSGAWGSAVALPNATTPFVPAIASCGDGFIDLVYAAGDGTPHHRTITLDSAGTLHLSADVSIGGRINASPALVCSGYRQMELVGRGTDNVPYYNHYVGPASPQGTIQGRTVAPGWQGWVEASRAYFTIPIPAIGWVFPGVIGDGIAVSGTRSGTVNVLARVPGDGAQRLFENRFDARRYGRSAWPAVEWRGFAQAGSDSYVGTPALGLHDRELIASCPLIAPFELTDGRVATPVAATDFPPVGETVIVSVGPEAYDIVSTDMHRSLRDIRVLNRSAGTLAVPTAAPVALTHVAATGTPSTLDVIASGADGRLFAWQRENEVWSGPTTLPFTVTRTPDPSPKPGHSGSSARDAVISGRTGPGRALSALALIPSRPGRLDLLAIGAPLNGSARLYHWQRIQGSWSNAQLLEAPFIPSPLRFNSSSVSPSGDGILDLAIVDNAGAMYFARLLPSGALDSWPARNPRARFTRFVPIEGNTIAAPALFSFDRNRHAILAIGTDQYLYQNASDMTTMPAIPPQWRGFKPLTASAAVIAGSTLVADDEVAAWTVVASNTGLMVDLAGTWSGFAPQASLSGCAPATALQ